MVTLLTFLVGATKTLSAQGPEEFYLKSYLKKCLFPEVAKRTAKAARGSTLLALPKNGAVVIILQLPCTSALLSATFYCKSTHDL